MTVMFNSCGLGIKLLDCRPGSIGSNHAETIHVSFQQLMWGEASHCLPCPDFFPFPCVLPVLPGRALMPSNCWYIFDSFVEDFESVCDL